MSSKKTKQKKKQCFTKNLLIVLKRKKTPKTWLITIKMLNSFIVNTPAFPPSPHLILLSEGSLKLNIKKKIGHKCRIRNKKISTFDYQETKMIMAERNAKHVKQKKKKKKITNHCL